MTTSPEQHVTDDLAAYLADGLTPAEQTRFKAHLRECPACAASLADSLAVDQLLSDAFADDRPDSNFEDRMITAFRSKLIPRRTIHPMVRRAAIGVAATLFLGGFGYFADRAVENGKLPSIDGVVGRVTRPQFASSAAVDVFASDQVAATQPASFREKQVTLGDGIVDEGLTDSFRSSVRDDRAGRLGRKTLFADGRVPFPTNADLRTGIDRGAAASTHGFGRLLTPAEQAPLLTSKLSIGLPGQNGTASTNALAYDRLDPAAKPSAAAAAVTYGLGVVNGPASSSSSSSAKLPQLQTFGASRGGGGAGGGGYAYDAVNGVADLKKSEAGAVVNGEVAVSPSAGATPGADWSMLNERTENEIAKARDLSFKPAELTQKLASLSTGTVAGRVDNGRNAGEAKDDFAASGVTRPLGNRELRRDVNRVEEKEKLAVASDAPPAPAGAPAPASPTVKTSEPALQTPPAELPALATAPPTAATPPTSTPPAAAPPVATPLPPAAPSLPTPQENAQSQRKIIRQGEMTFEVDSFDSSVMNVTKIVQEEQGFVATTDSDKLANGKVKGSIVLRVPPDHLDTLVLKLRGIGDLKSQKITAQDITKQYTDLESELRAARAMEERLLDIIKTGKGAVKDLLEAEKQLGVWREKIEQVEGEIRYDNNLVSLSTLTVDLLERDIKSAAFASESEQVNASLETEKVEEAYNAVKEAIGTAKGRIIQSDLKQYEAGQFGATVSAQLPPDAADAVIARIRQISGRVVNFQRTRSQSNQGGTAAPLDLAKVKREDVMLTLTIYNLANIAPRRTTSITLAANSVEEAYNAILDQANSAGARVVASNLNRPRPDQSTGVITLQTATDKADVLFAALRGAGELVRQETTDNPDTQNVTAAKRGFAIEIISLAALAPRRATNVTLAAADVDAVYRTLLDKINAAGGRVVGSTINRGTIEQTNASINFQISTEKADAISGDVHQAGEVMRQDTTENPDVQNTTASKRGFTVQVVSLAGVAARQTEQLQVGATSVADAFNGLLDSLRTRGARIVTSQLNQQDGANVTGSIEYELPRPAQLEVEASLGTDQSPGHADLISRNVSRSQDTDNTVDSKIHSSLALISANQMQPRQTNTLGVEVPDVQKSVEDLTSAAVSAGGRIVDRDISQEQNGRTVARVIVDVPLSQTDVLSDQVEHWGTRRVKQETRDAQVSDGKLARGRLVVTFANAATSLGGDETTWDAIRHGLTVSGAGLRWSLQMIVVGLCFVAPWALLIWGLWRVSRRNRRTTATSPTLPPTAAV